MTVLLCVRDDGLVRAFRLSSFVLRSPLGKDEFVAFSLHIDRVPGAKATFQDRNGQRVLDLALDHALERARAVGRVVAVGGELAFGGLAP